MTLRTFSILWLAAAFAAAGVMGGCNSGGGGGKLTDVQQAQRDEILAIQKIQEDIAAKKKVTKWEVSAKDVQADPRAKELKLDDEMGLQKIQGALGIEVEDMPPVKDFSGYKRIDWKNPDERLKKYSVNKRPPEGASPQMPSTGYEPFIDRYKDAKIVVMDLKVTTKAPPPPTEEGKTPEPPKENTIEITFGPIIEAEADKLIKQAEQAGTKVEKIKTYPAYLYIGPKGKIAVAVEGIKSSARLQPPRDLQYYMVDVATMEKLNEARKKEPTLPMMQPKMFDLAIIDYKPEAAKESKEATPAKSK
jgi:hypothetical protein